MRISKNELFIFDKKEIIELKKYINWWKKRLKNLNHVLKN